MRSIDIHAHLTPQCFWRATEDGSDWPFVQWEPSCVGWVQNLQSLTQEEKDKILWQNLEQLWGL